jgi:hypothetical protein
LTTAANKPFALYQGTTLVVPYSRNKRQGFSPCHRKICKKFQWKTAQGLKPHSLVALYGTTEVMP